MTTGAVSDTRTIEQLREHYTLERELAGRLRSASREERRGLYTQVYDELYRRISHHPTLYGEETGERASYLMRFLRPFLRPDMTFLEIGPGNCALSYAAAAEVRQVYAVDVSEVVGRSNDRQRPANVELRLFDGVNLPFPDDSIDLVYSNQVMEHVHPEDARDQVREVYRCLTPGGRFVVTTPNALNGPHDVSKYFDREPTCFHLKEYTTAELRALCRAAGFRRFQVYVGVLVAYLSPPIEAVLLFEAVLGRLPYAWRSRLGRTLPVSTVLGIRAVATK